MIALIERTAVITAFGATSSSLPGWQRIPISDEAAIPDALRRLG